MGGITVPWADLGIVTAVGLILGAGVVTLYAVGVRVLSPVTGSGAARRPGRTRIAAAAACFAVCAGAVAYGIWTLL